jgi:glycine/sarcosine/betaine reductase complex component A
MDLGTQQQVMDVVGRYSAENIVVLLGAPDPAGAEMFGLTLTEGDPTYAGPLAGVSLGLRVYHILEPEIRQLVDPEVYAEQVGIMELALDSDSIIAMMQQVRNGTT